MVTQTQFLLNEDYPKIAPFCPVFGQCGGCDFQDAAYEDELVIKENALRALLKGSLSLSDAIFDPIVASPRPSHYRHRLDLKLQKTKDGEVLIGFTPKSGYGTVVIDRCPIAYEEVSDFIPQLKKEALAKMTPKYRQANLVVKTGEDGRVVWGGMGRGSLELADTDYLWTTLENKKVFYSLNTFFQANLSILPQLIVKIKAFPIWDPKPHFYDLYGGVGLFGVALYELAQSVTLIENNVHSVRVARFNAAFHQFSQFDIIEKEVEAFLQEEFPKETPAPHIGMIDPPRDGLSEKARQSLVESHLFGRLMYLSCNPEALVRDLNVFQQNGWTIERIVPFDFFPRTKHLETLVLLKR